ncbi:MAG: PAS domain S-box protein [Planctomycetota bacterium]|nr:PAS domain S-box protein [Planctomycetota bacterium]
MSDETKTQAQLLEEVERLRREVADLKAALAARPDSRMPKELPGDYTLLFESFSEPLLVVRVRDGLILRANPFARRLVGATEAGLAGKTLYDLMPEDQGARAEAMMREAAAGNRLVPPHDAAYRRADGTLAPVRVTGAIVDSEPEATALFFMQDMTGTPAARVVADRKRAEEALRESERELNAIYQGMQDGILIADVGTRRFVRANPAALRMFGYSEEEMLHLSVPDIHPTDAWPQVLKVFTEQALGQRDVAPDLPCLRKDGTIFFADVPVGRMMHRGRPCMVGIFRDVTERRRAEETLRESEARYRAVVESQTELICRFGPESTLTFVNDAYCRFFGKSREELVGRSFLPLIAEEDRAEAVRHFAPVSADRPVVDHEHRVATPSGEVRWMRWVNGGIFDDQGRLVEFQAVGHDVTDRKIAEEALRQSEENYRLLFEESMLGIAVVVEGRIVKANKALCDIFRAGIDWLAARSVLELVAPGDRGRAAGQMAVLQGGTSSHNAGTYQVIRPDGTTGQVESRSGRVIWEGRPAVLSMIQDVTERVRLEDELREAQKMEAVGQLAGGIAHDFNNLLTGILCNAQLLKSTPGAAKDAYETADVIEKAARRAAELTAQLLGFARRGKRQDVPVDLGSTIRTVVRLMSGTLDPRIAVVTALPRESVWAQGDPAQMEQVALNLAMNARDAMPGGGRLTLSAEAADLDAAACAGRPKAKPGRYAVLSVSDTGRGVPEDIRERIFEPFFTTKPKGKGTGMGLPMVYGIARNHGGWVEVESAVGHGSTFRVYLPSPPSAPADARVAERDRRASPRRKAAGAKSPGRTPAPQAACVLVVDDDEFVRHAVTRMLTGMGYSVVTASSGREAIATYGMFGPSVDVVILDMVMPDLDGRECFRALRRLDPNIKAILCTGGPADGAQRDILEEGMAGFIQKPYRAEQLAAAIGEALAGSR